MEQIYVYVGISDVPGSVPVALVYVRVADGAAVPASARSWWEVDWQWQLLGDLVLPQEIIGLGWCVAEAVRLFVESRVRGCILDWVE